VGGRDETPHAAIIFMIPDVDIGFLKFTIQDSEGKLVTVSCIGKKQKVVERHL
jgi:hypothetical protein